MTDIAKRVLIVEDDPVLSGVLSEKLISEGFAVLKASDGPKGLDVALSNEPDLILLDNRMPTMSGYEMLTRLREKSSWGERVPVIFLSNLEPSSKDEQSAISATGAAHYLIKSQTSMEDIVKKIKELI